MPHVNDPDPADARAPLVAAGAAFARTRRCDGAAHGKNGSCCGDSQPICDSRLVSPNWPRVGLAMPFVAALLGLAEMALPPFATVIAVIAAMLGAWGSGLTRRLEMGASAPTSSRGLLLATAVALPLFLFGLGLGIWAQAGGIGWSRAIAALAIVSLATTAIQSGRLPGMLTVQAALWMGVACATGKAGTILAVVFGSLLAVLIYLRQAAEDARVRRRLDRERHVQHRAQEILADFEETGQGWFWETDRDGQIAYVSEPVARLAGRTVEELTGRPLSELFDLRDHSGEGERTLAFHLSARSAFSDLVVRAVACGGEERWWSVAGRPTYDASNTFQGFRGSGTDLTEKRRSQENANRLAHFDSLTGLSNRFRMSQTLERILATPQIQTRICAVFLLDLDRFKQVNDTLGHPAGDALLKQVAQRLEQVVGKSGRVGRLGGDEFQVILPGDRPREELGDLAHRIIELISQPYVIEGSRVTIGVTIGIALAPEDGVTSEGLARNVDLALYAAKDKGRGRYHFYAPDLHSDAEERRHLEDELRDAIAYGGLEMHYQPVIHTATEKITGFEALLRWNHPVHGWISPGRFIPIAEDAGLIAPIGEWALRTACLEMARWPREVRVAVNVSALQFANPSLPSIVISALSQAGIEPDRLELEITESVFLTDDEGTDAMFKALKDIGVRLALDDFGTGYSSLGYLKKAPFDKIKIDQSFVRGATQPGSRNGAIISSIVGLAEALDMETTAEGVETLDELELVRGLGVSQIQGFIYEGPLSPAKVAERLASGMTAIAHAPHAIRAKRRSTSRKIELEHEGRHYSANLRNISRTGALIQGLWDVPVGALFQVRISPILLVSATARWSAEDRMGIEFTEPLGIDQDERNAAAILPRQAA